MHCDQITNLNQTRLSLDLTSCHSGATFPIMTPILERLWHSVWDGIWGSCQHGYQAVEGPRPCYSSDFTSITLSARFLSSGAMPFWLSQWKPFPRITLPPFPPPSYCSSRWTVISLVLSTSASATQTWCFLNWSFHRLFYSTWLYKKVLWWYHDRVMVLDSNTHGTVM